MSRLRSGTSRQRPPSASPAARFDCCRIFPRGHKFAVRASRPAMPFVNTAHPSAPRHETSPGARTFILTTWRRACRHRRVSLRRRSIVCDCASCDPLATIHGYRRADGRVGTRNEIWILHRRLRWPHSRTHWPASQRIASRIASTASMHSLTSSVARNSAAISIARASSSLCWRRIRMRAVC